jgi:hypothetical protein
MQAVAIVIGRPGPEGSDAEVDISWTQLDRGAFHDEASPFFGVRPEHPLPVFIYNDRNRDDVGARMRIPPLGRDQDLTGVDMSGKTGHYRGGKEKDERKGNEPGSQSPHVKRRLGPVPALLQLYHTRRFSDAANWMRNATAARRERWSLRAYVLLG